MLPQHHDLKQGLVPLKPQCFIYILSFFFFGRYEFKEHFALPFIPGQISFKYSRNVFIFSVKQSGWTSFYRVPTVGIWFKVWSPSHSLLRQLPRYDG